MTPLTFDNIDVDATIKTVQQLLAEEQQLSPALPLDTGGDDSSG